MAASYEPGSPRTPVAEGVPFFVEDKEVIKTWVMKRLEKRVNIAAAEPSDLQNVLQLTSYEHLNLIPQKKSALLLTTLHSKEYHKSRKFLNYLKEMKMNGKEYNFHFF